MLNNLLDSLQAPKSPQWPLTYLDVSGTGWQENVISNIYAFYLDAQQAHNLGNSFVHALLDCVNKVKPIPTGYWEVKTWYVFREAPAIRDQRIDILLQDHPSRPQHAIIIENKVNHWLANNLSDYWESVNAPLKLGIVLSLGCEKSGHPEFPNILYLQYVEAIKNRLNNIPAASHSSHLTEFLQHLEKLTYSRQMNDQVSFFFERADAIRPILEAQEAARQYIIHQLRDAANLCGLTMSLNGTSYCAFYEKEETCFAYVISFDRLLAGHPEIVMLVQIQREAMSRLNDLQVARNTVFPHPENIQFDTKVNAHWTHTAVMCYKLQTNDLKALGQFISQKLQTDLKPYYDKIKSTWESFTS